MRLRFVWKGFFVLGMRWLFGVDDVQVRQNFMLDLHTRVPVKYQYSPNLRNVSMGPVIFEWGSFWWIRIVQRVAVV